MSIPDTAPIQPWNPRVTDLAPNVTTEQIAQYIAFHYDAVTQAGSFTFNSQSFIHVNGVAQPFSGTQTQVVNAGTADILAQTFGKGLKDPVTGAKLDSISVAGLSLYIKDAFDKIFAQRAASYGYVPPTGMPSALAFIQANGLYDLYGSGEDGYPLGKAFGGTGVAPLVAQYGIGTDPTNGYPDNTKVPTTDSGSTP